MLVPFVANAAGETNKAATAVANSFWLIVFMRILYYYEV
jgi:hypothetical protein